MTADYGGVVVEWTEGEAAKIAEIRERRPARFNESLQIPDMPEEQMRMAEYDRKRSTYEAMYWLWRCGVDYQILADIFDTPREVVRLAVKNRRGNRV